MKCNKCGRQLQFDDNFCPKCGDEISVICPKCGRKIKAKSFFCPNCGCENPYKEAETTEEELSDFDLEIKRNEINRLIEANLKWGGGEECEPKVGLLTDDEVLKYSPNSKKAEEIIKNRKMDAKFERIENSSNIFERIRYDGRIQALIVALLMLFGPGILSFIFGDGSLWWFGIALLFGGFFVPLAILLVFYEE